MPSAARHPQAAEVEAREVVGASSDTSYGPVRSHRRGPGPRRPPRRVLGGRVLRDDVVGGSTLGRSFGLAASEHRDSFVPRGRRRGGLPCAEPSRSHPRRGRAGQRVHLVEDGVLDPLDDELGDPVAAVEHDRLPRVEVDERHLDLAAVAGVDRAGRVDQRHAVLHREPGPRVHEGGVPLGQRDRDAGREQHALPRRALGVDGGDEVDAGVARVRVRRQRHVGVEPPHEHVDGVRRAASRVHLEVRQAAADARGPRAAASTSSGRPLVRSARPAPGRTAPRRSSPRGPSGRSRRPTARVKTLRP